MNAFVDFSWSTLAIIALGGFTGGIVNGLTGFGTGISALPIWLQALPPPLSAQLAAAGGVAGQILTFRSIWHTINWRSLMPMLIAGVIGIPIGTYCLTFTPVATFKLIVGLALVAYAACMLIAGDRIRLPPGGRAAEAAVGFAGGVMAGLAGMSGVAPTIWAALQGWTKERRRGVFQAFNFVILGTTLIAHAVGGLISASFLTTVLVALPGTFLGVNIGRRLYLRLDDKGFDRVILILLGVAGVMQLTIGLR